MSKLERICDDHLMLPVGSLQNLTTIYMVRCHVLQYLFPSHLALRGLPCLKEIQVWSCESLESIVSRDQLDDEEEIIEFSQLRKLMVNNLDRFISFFCTAIISSSQERQKQDPTSSNQQLLTSLFNKVVLPKLEELKLTDMRVDQIWDDQLPTEAGRTNYCWFRNLTILTVDNCNNLSYLFNSSMVKSLAQLQELVVDKCESIEEIVATGKGEELEDIVFGKLETLILKSLRSLTSFTTNDCNFQFPSLERVFVEKCPKMEFFCKGALSTPKLSEVCVARRRKMWESDLNSTVRHLYKEMSLMNEEIEYEYEYESESESESE